MAAIDNYLQQIRTAVYGRDVRAAIANGIEECYQRDRELNVNNSVTVDGIVGNIINHTAVCTTASNATAKAASVLSGSFSLVRGAKVTVLFSQTNTATSPTLNINGTGAKAIYYHGSRMGTGNPAIIAGACDFVYDTDTSAWHLIGGTTVQEETDLSNYSTTAQMNTAISQAINSAAVDLSPYMKTETANQQFASISTNSFRYVICPNNSTDIPLNVENSSGTVGMLQPSVDTMYCIYLVPVRTIPGHFYDSYITVKNDSTYRWERLGGEEIDLSAYLTAAQAASQYVSIEYVDEQMEEVLEAAAVDLTPYQTAAEADAKYAPADIQEFSYLICNNVAAEIPYGVVNARGTEGTMRASPSTMYQIYFVQVRTDEGNRFDEYVTVEINNNYYWEKLGGKEYDMTQYITEAEIADAYVTKSLLTQALSSYITPETLAGYGFMTKTNADEAYMSINEKPFKYHICIDAPNALPFGVTNSHGTVGTVEASEATMYDVYLVPINAGGKSTYDEYITVELYHGRYEWEKLGSEEIDISKYSTTAEIAANYVAATDLETRLASYLTAAQIRQDYMTRTEIGNTYATKNYVDSQVSQAVSGGALNLDNYLTKSDAAMTYATIGEFANAIQNGDLTTNKLYLLEIENIPGTTQNITFKSNGEISEIRHMKDYSVVRRDAYTFSDNEITEVRTLNSGEKLTIVTDTSALSTTTTYAAG